MPFDVHAGEGSEHLGRSPIPVVPVSDERAHEVKRALDRKSGLDLRHSRGGSRDVAHVGRQQFGRGARADATAGQGTAFPARASNSDRGTLKRISRYGFRPPTAKGRSSLMKPISLTPTT